MMNTLKAVLGCSVVVACCALCSVSSAEDAPRVSVSVASNCVSYGMADNVSLHVQIENQGSSPVVMYGKIGWGELSGLTLKVSGESGRTIQPVALDDDMVIPSTLRDRNYYVTIFKSQFIGISRSERASELFPGVGKYKVWVEYMSPVPKGSSLLKHSFWSMESGKVISNVLILSIVEGTSCKPAKLG